MSEYRNGPLVGLLDFPPDPARYENTNRDPDEVAMKIAYHVPIGSRVLDVGCGTGSVSQIVLEEKAVDLTALEPDRDRAAIARKRGLKVVEGYLTKDFFARHGKFDTILIIDVLEHLAEPGPMLQLIHTGLTPGGRLVASVPNVAHWSVRAGLFFGEFNYEPTGIMDATHLRWFTQKTLTKVLERTGYKVTSIDSTLGLQLPCYGLRPIRWVPSRMKKLAVRFMAKQIPTAFACQHIVVAQAQ